MFGYPKKCEDIMKVCVVLGTRPEIIKMSPVIRALQEKGLDYFILHTGQHYSYNMDRVFFEQLGLPDAKYNLEVGSGRHGEQTGKMLALMENVFLDEKPNVVLVQGDTNTVLAGALAASKLHIKIGHVEAGLRSYDRLMPEETNRVLADHISDYLFAPTEKSKELLLCEGIPESRIFVTGNTVVDALYQNLEISKMKSDVLKELGLEPKGYFLATAHRQENVDDPVRFGGMIEGMREVAKEHGIPVVYPIHPRARKMLDLFDLDTAGIRLLEPVDYLSFLQLMKNARLILTDSGGIQEEACSLKVPCVTLRDNTERPETIDVGANLLAGTIPEKISECVQEMILRSAEWENPFGDGNAGMKIVDIIGSSVDA